MSYNKNPYQISAADLAAYQSGEAIYSIAKRNNVSSSSVKREIVKMGIPILPNKQNLGIVLTDADIKACQEGQPATSLVEKYQVSLTTINRLLKSAGVKLKQANQYPHPYAISNKDLWNYKRGESAYSIAERNFTSATSVLRQLKRNGIKLRTFHESMELIKENNGNFSEPD